MQQRLKRQKQEENQKILDEEIEELRDLKDVDDDQFGALNERRNHIGKTLKLLEEKRNLTKVAQKRTENALDLEKQLRLKELREGRLRSTSEDDLADIIGTLVRKEVAKLALASKASQMRRTSDSPDEAGDEREVRKEPTYAELLKRKDHKNNLASMPRQERESLNINANQRLRIFHIT